MEGAKHLQKPQHAMLLVNQKLHKSMLQVELILVVPL